MVEQKKREVDALKVVMEEKAELMEQVKTLQAELDDMSRYQVFISIVLIKNHNVIAN